MKTLSYNKEQKRDFPGWWGPIEPEVAGCTTRQISRRINRTKQGHPPSGLSERSHMADVNDVAAAILDKTGEIDTFKLQKLVYYSQAWYRVWKSKPLFTDEIQAWAGGPVVPSLYSRHRGRFSVSEWPWGDPKRLTADELEVVESIVDAYGRLTGYQLSQLTHSEAPWIRAREGLAPGQRGSRIIELDDIYDYYSDLDQNPEATDISKLTFSEDEPL